MNSAQKTLDHGALIEQYDSGTRLAIKTGVPYMFIICAGVVKKSEQKTLQAS